MARLELYLFFVTMMQKFSFEKYGEIKLKGDLGLVVEPKPCNAFVRMRK